VLGLMSVIFKIIMYYVHLQLELPKKTLESHGHEGETIVIRNANIKFKDGRPGLDSWWGRKVFYSQ
jgi:hypothetical protein